MLDSFKLIDLVALPLQPAWNATRVKYLLRDDFITELAAGEIDGTDCEPGPGTRVVADTGSNLSISGGELVSAGFVGDDDPGLWLDSVARAAGRLLRIDYTHNSNVLLGWDDDQAGFPTSLFRNSATSVRIYIAGGPVSENVGPITGGKTYALALVMRTAGFYFLIKGNEFPDWSLVWVDDANADDPMYPVVGVDAADGLMSVGSIRVPDVLWFPTPAAYDTFTRSNGALGTSETSGPDSQAVTARTWNNRVGTTQVASNKASASALSGGIAIATVDTGKVDVLCKSALTRSGDEIGIVVRYADSDNYVRAYHDGTNVKLDKVVGGTPTNVISAAQAYSAGADIVVSCVGTSFLLFYDDRKIGSTSTISNAALQTGTEQGTYSTNTGNSQDDLAVFPRGTDGEYSKLNRY
jgi:hypothetical protein